MNALSPCKSPVESFSMLFKVHWACCDKLFPFLFSQDHLSIPLSTYSDTFSLFSSYGFTNSVTFGFEDYDSACSNWFMVFLSDIVLQWSVLIGIAAMIAARNGRT